MGRNVFANGLEISAKASDNRSIAAMPDVCLSPPGPPSGPVPIAYPNSAFARDTTGGTRTVKIGGQEVGKKNISKYRKSTGDEPATRNFGMGVISHNITGPMKFAAWSMDVKFEGANVTRFMDLTTHNHTNTTNGGIGMSLAQAFLTLVNSFICAKLEGMNNTVRENTKMKIRPDGKPFKKLDQGQSGIRYREATPAQLNKIAMAGTRTVAHAIHISETGNIRILKACSNRLAHELFDPSFVPGIKTQDEIEKRRKKINGIQFVESYICGGGKHFYRDIKRPGWTHAESRILETIFRSRRNTTENAGSLLLNIDWGPNPPKGKSRSPCNKSNISCLRLLCAARQCIEIRRCTEKNMQQDIADDCKKAGINIPQGPAWKK
ncbi:DUF4150 domain-containing protein [Pseudomonas indica]|uniref:DUF4150 domain-containing protein n=1 Tax=Pseudomonas indica TaxID=137658 RepID=UPI000BAB2505|nr:DUF4150 domain-containing protein [Pseudomonas indica]PAU64858.1 hypothetical protein BZL42_01175 [Pseudomonas indica]